MAMVSVAEAATRLGIGVDAVRKRIARGSLESRRGNDGRILVELPPDGQVQDKGDETALEIAELRREVERWRGRYEEESVARATAVADLSGTRLLIEALREELALRRQPWWRRVWGATRPE